MVLDSLFAGLGRRLLRGFGPFGSVSVGLRPLGFRKQSKGMYEIVVGLGLQGGACRRLGLRV